MESVQRSILSSGTIIAGMKVYRDFLNYKSGVYHHVAGSWLFNLAVKIVGWGVQQGTGVPYWIAANSWSSVGVWMCFAINFYLLFDHDLTFLEIMFEH